MNFKNLLKKISKELTFSNLDKVLNTINTSFTKFSSGMNQINKGVDNFLEALSDDYKKSDRQKKSRAVKDGENIKILFGNSTTKIWSDSNSSNDVKIWSDKKSKEKLF